PRPRPAPGAPPPSAAAGSPPAPASTAPLPAPVESAPHERARRPAPRRRWPAPPPPVPDAPRPAARAAGLPTTPTTPTARGTPSEVRGAQRLPRAVLSGGRAGPADYGSPGHRNAALPWPPRPPGDVPPPADPLQLGIVAPDTAGVRTR